MAKRKKRQIMTIVLERSTVALVASFRDENDDLVTPTAIEWDLTDGDGNIINNRDGQSVAVANTITIVLSGDDLALTNGDDGKRQAVIRGVYDGDLGSDLPIVGVLEFTVRNIPGIA
jgi:hypothetical protein